MKEIKISLVLFFFCISLSLYAFTVTFSVDKESRGLLSGETVQNVSSGKYTTRVFARAGEHYRFSHFGGGITNTTENPISIKVTKDLNVTAYFDLETYDVSFSSNDPLQGSVTGETLQKVAYLATSSPVKAEPAEGYRFEAWYDSAGSLLSYDNPYSLTNVTKAIDVYANFIEDVIFKVCFLSASGGRLEGDTIQYVTEGFDSTFVEAVPDTGFIFKGWSGDFTSNLNPLRIIEVKKDTKVSPNFIRDNSVYLLRLRTTPVNAISFENSVVAVKPGESINLFPVLNDGYKFIKWMCKPENACEIKNPDSLVTTVSNVSSDAILTARCYNEENLFSISSIKLRCDRPGRNRDSIFLYSYLETFSPHDDYLTFSIGDFSKTFFPENFNIHHGYWGRIKKQTAIWYAKDFRIRLVNHNFSSIPLGENIDVSFKINDAESTKSYNADSVRSAWKPSENNQLIKRLKIRLHKRNNIAKFILSGKFYIDDSDVIEKAETAIINNYEYPVSFTERHHDSVTFIRVNENNFSMFLKVISSDDSVFPDVFDFTKLSLILRDGDGNDLYNVNVDLEQSVRIKYKSN